MDSKVMYNLTYGVFILTAKKTVKKIMAVSLIQ